MTTSEADQKEYWTTSKIVEELHHNLISSKGEDGLRKYEEKAKTLLYKIPICMDSKQGDKQAPSFTVEIKDLSEEVKEQIANISDREYSRSIVKEAISLLFENLGPKEKEYYNKNVRHLLRVNFV